MCNRVKWNEVLGNELYAGAMTMFATNRLSGKKVERIFRLTKNHEVSGQVRKMLRERGVMESRRICRKSLRRREMID